MAGHIHIHSQMPCEGILAQLGDYLDGDLAAGLCRDLEQHLAGCPDCRVVLDTLNKTVLLYRSLREEPVPLPSDVEARLLERLGVAPGEPGM